MTLLLCPKTVFLNPNTAARPTSINNANAAFPAANNEFFYCKKQGFRQDVFLSPKIFGNFWIFYFFP